MIDIPAVVRRRAIALGAAGVVWLDELPSLVADLERDWSMTIGRTYQTGTEAFVAEVTLDDGSAAVVKVLVPHEGGITHEATVLTLADGDGCARMLRHDPARDAILLERLGRPLVELDLPVHQRHEILCATASRVWRPAPDAGLPTGAQKGRYLIDCIAAWWEELDHPCSERAVEYAIACAERRIAAHDDERAVLVHGDVQQWNALEANGGFKLVDPDGLLADAEYDLGIIMREDPTDGDLRERAAWLATRTGLDESAIWEWGAVERVSTGLLATKIDLQPVGGEMLAAADRAAVGQ